MVNLILGDFDRTYELVCDVTGITKVNIRKGWTFVIKLKFFLCFIILITRSKTVETSDLKNQRVFFDAILTDK